MPPFGRTAGDRVLHAIAGEDFQASVVELHRNVDNHLARRRAQHLLHPFVEAQARGGFVKSHFGGYFRIKFGFECRRHGRFEDHVFSHLDYPHLVDFVSRMLGRGKRPGGRLPALARSSSLHHDRRPRLRRPRSNGDRHWHGVASGRRRRHYCVDLQQP